MKKLTSIITLTALFAIAALARAADEPSKPKTQKIIIKPERGNAGQQSFDLVQLPAGQIALPDKNGDAIKHEIKPIWMSTTEITWDVYDIFWQRLDIRNPWQQKAGADAKSRPSLPYAPPDSGFGREGFPAAKIHFQSAKQFCAWLSSETGKKFRLPTDAEWEYACRAGGPARLKPADLDQVAWYEGNSKDNEKYPVPRAVGKKKANAFGLYDMLGNVAEYVIRDPSDLQGVVAGGSFLSEAKDVHAGAREPYKREWQKSDPQDPLGRGWLSDGQFIGIRVVMEE